MNLKISNDELLSACRELIASAPEISGRALRAAMARRFGASGGTDRVYSVWRSLRAETGRAVAAPMAEASRELEDARRQIEALKTALSDAEHRALRSEERERLHQDRWANEIHHLREQVALLQRGTR